MIPLIPPTRCSHIFVWHAVIPPSHCLVCGAKLNLPDMRVIC